MCRRVLIVDDHAEFRRRTHQLLEVEGFEVVGEAADGAEGLRAANDTSPDLVLLDVHLPDALGFELVADFAGGQPPASIILISTHDEEAYRVRAAACGACGFITKDELNAAAIERALS